MSDEDVRHLVDMPAMVAKLESGLRAEANGEVAVPPRLNAEAAGTWIRMMPAVLPGLGILGFKVFHGNSAYGARFLVVLSSVESGEILALLDARHLTAARTAATTAVAARYLAPAGPWRLALIGSGLEASTHCAALSATHELTDIRVYSPNAGRREAFAAATRAQLGIPVTTCDDPLAAIDGADHVVVATHTGPGGKIAYRAQWLTSGQHVSSIGSTNRRIRELETEVFHQVDTVAFDVRADQVVEESADLHAYAAEYDDIDRALWLPAIVAADGPARTSSTQTTLFKSVGSALQDVVAAAQIYEAALRERRGTEVGEISSLKLPTQA